MACQIVDAPGALFVLWGVPDPADVDAVGAALERAAKANGGPVVYVTRVPASAPAPDAATRKYLEERMPEFAKHFSTYHVVLEGDGFAAAMKRGVVSGLFRLKWKKETYFVHATAAEVPNLLRGSEQRAAQEVIRLATAQGLLRKELTAA